MKGHSLLLLRAAAVALSAVAVPALADTLYSQPFDANGIGNFSNAGSQVIYDNFTPSQSGTIGAVTWQGSYNLTPETNFTINFYQDDGGTPGARILSTSATPTITDTGVDNIFEIYSYTADVPSLSVLGGDQYWISIFGSTGGQNWIWWVSAEGDGSYYEQAGTLNQNIGEDAAFTLLPATTTPEPSSLVLLGTAFAGTAGLLRRRARA